jgi:uncharacterized protein (TIGR02265 family)
VQPDESVTVKGSPVRSLQKFIDAELTPAQRDAVFAKLPAEFATRLRAPILPTETIPVHVLNRLTEEAAKAKNEPMETFARRAGREAASDAVKGIYRFFALALTPAALLGKGSQMWSTLYSRGQLKVDEQTDSSARIRLADYPTERVNCERITGWVERMAEMTGAKDIRIEQTKCFARGAIACEWEIRWK